MKFDLRKPETLLMPEEIDLQLHNHVTEDLFKKILTWGRALNVSDISIQAGFPVKIKKNNLVFNITRAEVPATAITRFIGVVYRAPDGDDAAYQRVMSGEDSNTTYTFKVGPPGKKKVEIRYRVNCLRDGDTDAAITMRYNASEILSLADIGQTRDGEIYRNMFPMKGLNLITGSVDSGKTTLIYACLQEFILNDKRHAFINTYENPIEGDLRELARVNQIENKSVHQCPVPLGAKSYTVGIEQSLRKNADIILTGEVRTQDEVMGVINGVLSSGKLLLATLHTDSIPMTFSRLFNTLQSTNEGQMRSMVFDLIKSMNMIVSQSLLQTIELKRIAVYETLIFTKEIKARLLSVPVEMIAQEITSIMKESKNTMVDKARVFYEDGAISDEVFRRFEADFSY